MYVDDIIIFAETKELAAQQTAALISMCNALGLAINEKKSSPEPQQRKLYLGHWIDLVSHEFQPREEKVAGMRKELKNVQH
jgi:hypothetical protein